MQAHRLQDSHSGHQQLNSLPLAVQAYLELLSPANQQLSQQLDCLEVSAQRSPHKQELDCLGLSLLQEVYSDNLHRQHLKPLRAASLELNNLQSLLGLSLVRQLLQPPNQPREVSSEHPLLNQILAEAYLATLNNPQIKEVYLALLSKSHHYLELNKPNNLSKRNHSSLNS
jgi:hypothetical protein